MATQKVLLVVIGVVVLGGTGWFITLNHSTEPAATKGSGGADTVAKTEKLQKTPEIQTTQGTGSLMNLLRLGTNMRCTYVHSDPKIGTGNGTAYIEAAGRMRTDSMNTRDGKTFEMHVIKDAETVYLWMESDTGNFATKMPLSMTQQQGSGAQSTNTNGSESLYENVTYDCAPWVVDESVFTPPEDIEFTDLTEMFKNVFKGIPATN